MPTSASRDYERIDRLAEEFVKRFRDGERPSVQEYCDKYPHVAGLRTPGKAVNYQAGDSRSQKVQRRPEFTNDYT